MSKKPSKLTFWQNHIEQHQTSDLSQQAYCKQNALKLHQMVYWRRKILSESEQAKPSNGFVAIPLTRPRGEGLRVSLPNGILISGFGTLDDVAQLLKVLS